MSGRSTVLAWTGLAAGAGVLGLAGALLQRTLVPTLEIRRYADDVAAATERAVRNTDVVAELGRLRELSARLRPPAADGGS